MLRYSTGVTLEIALVFLILGAALVLFITEVIPMDLVSLLVLVVLFWRGGLNGLVDWIGRAAWRKRS